jgi:hypothetical protein
MEAAQEKIHHLKDRYAAGDDPNVVPEDFITRPARDMGKISMFISLLAIILVVIFFFGIKSSITGLEHEVEQVAGIRGEFVDMNTKFTGLESKVAAFEGLPEKTRQMVISNLLEDTTQRLDHLSGKLGADQKAQVAQALEILRKVQAGVPK